MGYKRQLEACSILGKQGNAYGRGPCAAASRSDSNNDDGRGTLAKALLVKIMKETPKDGPLPEKNVNIAPATSTSTTAGRHSAENRRKKDKPIHKKLEERTAEAEDFGKKK